MAAAETFILLSMIVFTDGRAQILETGERMRRYYTSLEKCEKSADERANDLERALMRRKEVEYAATVCYKGNDYSKLRNISVENFWDVSESSDKGGDE